MLSKAAILLSCAASAVTAQGGLFIVHCAPLTVQRTDPIISPGGLSSHVHAVVGGTAFDKSMTNEDARKAANTTCDKSLDKSNYWQPQLYHQRNDSTFELIPLLGIAGYYIDRSCDYKEGRKNCRGAVGAIAPPAGLRMVSGDTFRRSYNHADYTHRAISHVCLDPGKDTVFLDQKPCKEMRAQVFFPSCWDGQNLDSADHKSHMSFPALGDYNTGVCPKSHPVAIVSVFNEFFYNTRQVQEKDFGRWVYANGDTTGYGLHGDFLQGWTDQDALEHAMATCTGNRGADDPNCSLNVGPNGPGRVARFAVEKPAPAEDIGLNGRLTRLPGNNAVYQG